jgi:UDP-2,3-diacylglucosamine pyrophosphatase LpxH
MKRTLMIIVGTFISLLVIGGFFFIVQKIFFDHQTKTHLADAKKIYDSLPPWHKKIKTDQEVKIGLITDTHVRPIRADRSDERDDAPRKLKDDQKDPLERFVEQMKAFDPHFIVHLGDIIEGTNDDQYVGSQGVMLVREELENAGASIYWTVGNHDLRSLTKEQFKKILGIESLDQVFDIGDYRFIIIDANYNLDDQPRTPDGNAYIRGKLPQMSLEWLEGQLKTNKRVILFMHHGSFTTDSAGDPKDMYRDLYDENDNDIEYDQKQSIINAQVLNNLLREYRVDAVFNGHMEARRFEIFGSTAHYSLTGTKKSYTYPRSFYELTLKNGKPDVTMYYVPAGMNETKVIDFEDV